MSDRTAAFAGTVERLLAPHPGATVAVAVRAPDGARYDRRADEPLPSASVIKLGILLELLARAEEGDLDMGERRELRESDKVPGSGVLTGMRAGLSLSLFDLAALMITVSDNTASNMLIDRLGLAAINARLASIPLPGTRLERKFYDFVARDQGRDNWATAADMAALLAVLATRPAALAILKRQQFGSRIPRYLPPDTEVAHKTGSVSGVYHDAGIIYAPAGPLTVVVLTRGLANEREGEEVIGRLALQAYETWGLTGGG